MSENHPEAGWVRRRLSDEDLVLGRGSPDVMSRPRKYPEELVQRGIRLALESGRPIAHVAADLGMHPETLRKRVRQAEADSGSRPDLPTTAEREEIRKLRAENFELRRANEILKSASVFFATELDADRTR
jgi:transposase